jgi:16S rRNA C1402 N4-methylase RsmH
VEYFLKHLEQDNPEECKNLKIVACDVDEKVMAKGKEFVAQRKNQISFYHSSYANIKEISQKE